MIRTRRSNWFRRRVTKLMIIKGLQRRLYSLENAQIRQMRNARESQSLVDLAKKVCLTRKHVVFLNIAIQIIQSRGKFVRNYPAIDDMMAMMVNSLQEDTDISLQHISAATMAFLSPGREELVLEFISRDGVPALKSLMFSREPFLRRSAILALGNIAINGGKMYKAVAEVDFIDDLVLLIKMTTDEDTLYRSTKVILKLYRFLTMVDFTEEVFPCLVPLLEHEHTPIVLNALSILTYITAHNITNIQWVIESKVPGILASKMDSRDVSVMEKTMQVLANLANGPNDQIQKVLDKGVLQKILPYLIHDSPKVRTQAMRLISNISTGSEAQLQAIVDENLVEDIVENLYTIDRETVIQTAMAIGSFTVHCNYQQMTEFVLKGVMAPLIDSLWSMDDELIYIVLTCLNYMLSKGGELANNVAAQIGTYKGVTKIKLLMHHDDLQICLLAFNIVEQKFTDLFTATEFRELRKLYMFRKREAIREQYSITKNEN